MATEAKMMCAELEAAYGAAHVATRIARAVSEAAEKKLDEKNTAVVNAENNVESVSQDDAEAYEEAVAVAEAARAEAQEACSEANHAGAALEEAGQAEEEAEAGTDGGIVDGDASSPSAIAAGRHAECVVRGFVDAAAGGEAGFVRGAADGVAALQGALEGVKASPLQILARRDA